MNERIVIVEDRAPVGMLLRDYLNSELARLITLPSELGAPRNPRTGYEFLDLHDEPGQGQLIHLDDQPQHDARVDGGHDVVIPSRRIRTGRGDDNDHEDHEQDKLEIEFQHLPTAELFPLNRLDELRKLAKLYTPNPGYRTDDLEDPRLANVREYVSRWGGGWPNILIVDLATTIEEVNDMEGALAHMTAQEFLAADSPVDPRPALRDMTGFKLLRLFSEIPVIVTAFWPHPLVMHHCLVNGAFAYVQKPMLTKAVSESVAYWNKQPQWQEFDRIAKTGGSADFVVIQHYLTSVAAEVLKAMSARHLRFSV